MRAYDLFTRAGTPLARGLYGLEFTPVLDPGDAKPELPIGCFLLDRGNVYGSHPFRPSWSLPCDAAAALQDSRQYVGCCGNCGDIDNLIDPANGSEIGASITDCWLPHSCRFPLEALHAVPRPDLPPGRLFVGVLDGSPLLLGAAGGASFEAVHDALLQRCRQRLAEEAPERAPVDSAISFHEAGDFFARQGGAAAWLFIKYGKGSSPSYPARSPYEKYWRLGFTGSSRSLSGSQLEEIRRLFVFFAERCRRLGQIEAEIHHGDCIGADVEVHRLAREAGLTVILHSTAAAKWKAVELHDRTPGLIHAPSATRGCKTGIADSCDLLIACLDGVRAERMVRHAERLGKPVVLLPRDSKESPDLEAVMGELAIPHIEATEQVPR